MGNNVANSFPILPIHSQTRKHTTCICGGSRCTIWYTQTSMSGSFAHLFVCKLASGWTGSGWSLHVCEYFLTSLRVVCELANAPKRELFVVDHMVHQRGLFACLVGPGVPLRACKHYVHYSHPPELCERTWLASGWWGCGVHCATCICKCVCMVYTTLSCFLFAREWYGLLMVTP